MPDDDPSAEDAAAAAKADVPEDDPGDQPGDDLRRRFRAALASKQGPSGAQSRGHESGHGPALRSNDKRQRTFRRKAGG